MRVQPLKRHSKLLFGDIVVNLKALPPIQMIWVQIVSHYYYNCFKDISTKQFYFTAFITAGFDKIVAKWRKQKILWKVNTQSELISAAYHPTASVVVAGSIDGHFVALNAETGVHVCTVRVGSAPLNAMKFNQSGSQLACATNGIINTFRYN